MVAPVFGTFEKDNGRISTEFIPLFSKNEISNYLDPVELSHLVLTEVDLKELCEKASSSKTAKTVKEFFKEFKNKYGSWPTSLNSEETERAKQLSVPGNRNQIGEKDRQILEKLKGFMLEDKNSNSNPETPESESQDN